MKFIDERLQFNFPAIQKRSFPQDLIESSSSIPQSPVLLMLSTLSLSLSLSLFAFADSIACHQRNFESLNPPLSFLPLDPFTTTSLKTTTVNRRNGETLVVWLTQFLSSVKQDFREGASWCMSVFFYMCRGALAHIIFLSIGYWCRGEKTYPCLVWGKDGFLGEFAYPGKVIRKQRVGAW